MIMKVTDALTPQIMQDLPHSGVSIQAQNIFSFWIICMISLLYWVRTVRRIDYLIK